MFSMKERLFSALPRHNELGGDTLGSFNRVGRFTYGASDKADLQFPLTQCIMTNLVIVSHSTLSICSLESEL